MGSYHIILLFRELLNFSSDNADLGAEFVYSRGKEGGGGGGRESEDLFSPQVL